MKNRSKYTLEYRKNNIQSYISYKLNIKLLSAFKRNSKKSSVPDLIGCSIKEAKEYIESKFLPGMSWDNWTKTGWHIDHIVPCIKFDLTKEEEQKRCFHYTNLQPLWAKDNLSHNQYSNVLKKTEITNKPRNKIVHMTINSSIDLPYFLAYEIKKILDDSRIIGTNDSKIDVKDENLNRFK